MNPLYTFGIISYNNYRYLPALLDSILKQTYSNIEIIIADDASDDFNVEACRSYIESNKRDNIRNVIIHQQPTNVGTVRNAEWCRLQSSGDYFHLIAADDWLVDESVVARYMDAAANASKSILAFSGHTLMIASDQSEPPRRWATPSENNRIKEEDPGRLYSFLCGKTIIPTPSTIFKKELFNIVGGYSTEYHLIEDATLFLKAARNGVIFRLIDDLDAVYHRSGGVCHSGDDFLSPSYRMYLKDRMRIFEEEVFPHADLCLAEDYPLMLKLWKSISEQYIEAFAESEADTKALRNTYEPIAYIPQLAYRGTLLEKKNVAAAQKTFNNVCEKIEAAESEKKPASAPPKARAGWKKRVRRFFKKFYPLPANVAERRIAKINSKISMLTKRIIEFEAATSSAAQDAQSMKTVLEINNAMIKQQNKAICSLEAEVKRLSDTLREIQKHTHDE